MRLWSTVQVTIGPLTATDNRPSNEIELTVARVIRATIHFLLVSMSVHAGNFMDFRNHSPPLLHLPPVQQELRQALRQEHQALRQEQQPSSPPAVL